LRHSADALPFRARASVVPESHFGGETMKRTQCAQVFVIALAAAAGAAFGQQFTVTQVGPADWISSRGLDINDRGDVVGSGLNRTAQSRAFSKFNAVAAVELPSAVLVATAVNNNGLIAGQGQSGLSWLFDGVTLTPVPALDNTTNNVFVWDVSDAGAAVGAARQDVPLSSQKAFLWTGNAPVDLGDFGGNNSVAYGMNESNDVVGAARTGDGQLRAFLYDGDSLIDLTGARGGTAYAINENGVVAGVSGGEAFTWQSGNSSLLGSIGSPVSSTAWGINDFGVVVGDSNDKAFIFRGNTLTDLNALIPANSGWDLQSARAINNFGEITGFGTFNGRTRAFLLAPVCRADFNQDGSVDFFDYLDFVAAFDSEGPLSDFNRDGTVDFFDYLDFVAAFDVPC
jgi:probable HAF family extracellular repeat protein